MSQYFKCNRVCEYKVVKHYRLPAELRTALYISMFCFPFEAHLQTRGCCEASSGHVPSKHSSCERADVRSVCPAVPTSCCRPASNPEAHQSSRWLQWVMLQRQILRSPWTLTSYITFMIF